MRGFSFSSVVLLTLVLAACAARPPRYCTETGQPAREGISSFKGNKQCTLKKGRDGQFVKEGPYVEWFPSGKPALTGEYKDGKKTGKWIEWEESGKKITERWFDNGVETPTRAVKAAPALAPAPIPAQTPTPVSTAPSQPPRQRPQ